MCKTKPIPGGRDAPPFHHSSIPGPSQSCETKPISGARRETVSPLEKDGYGEFGPPRHSRKQSQLPRTGPEGPVRLRTSDCGLRIEYGVAVAFGLPGSFVRNKANLPKSGRKDKYCVERDLRQIRLRKGLDKTKPICHTGRGGQGLGSLPVSPRGELCETKPIGRGVSGWKCQVSSEEGPAVSPADLLLSPGDRAGTIRPKADKCGKDLP